jgi:predicted transcriptional regulator
MTTVLKPSVLLPRGLQVQQINNLTLFKFTDELGERMQTLLDKKKADDLSPEEALELEAIGELDEIFSYINAVIAARGNGHS